MSTFLLIIVLVLGVALAITYFLKRRVEKTMAAAQKQAAEAQKEARRGNLASAWRHRGGGR